MDCKFDTYDDLLKVVNLVAEVLGTQEAIETAEKYEKYFRETVENAKTIIPSGEEDEKITALILKDTKTYSAYGVARYTGEWITICGADYAMVNEDVYANVSLTKEQLIEYNPDIIFFAMPGQAEDFKKDVIWESLDAIQNNRVYNVPGGFNTWSNCGAESALIFKWAPVVMYPNHVKNTLEKDVKDFYFTFYNIEVSDDEYINIMESSFK